MKAVLNDNIHSNLSSFSYLKVMRSRKRAGQQQVTNMSWKERLQQLLAKHDVRMRGRILIYIR